MEQKKNQKDVLIVRDEKTGEISVVAGLKKDGRFGSQPEGFSVVRQEQQPAGQLSGQLFPVMQGAETLRLLPCGGGEHRACDRRAQRPA